MRDDKWLWGLLDETWDEYFSDVAQVNTVKIRFGRRAKTRLGSIMLDRRDPTVTIITLNGLFKDLAIPNVVIQATLVHELCHYAHGFNSPHAQKFRHPHAGGVMKAEFEERGLGWMYVEQKKWVKANWRQVVEQNFGPSRRRPSSRVVWSVIKKPGAKVPRPFWF